MEIEVGEFVRTGEGIIDKVIIDYHSVCNSPSCNCKHVSCKKDYYDEEDIVKHSKNLIDLIEVGDYVNGLEVYKGRVANGKEKLLVGNYLINGMALEVVNIKTILTHEIYERNMYRVEE